MQSDQPSPTLPAGNLNMKQEVLEPELRLTVWGSGKGYTFTGGGQGRATQVSSHLWRFCQGLRLVRVSAQQHSGKQGKPHGFSTLRNKKNKDRKLEK